MKSIRNEILVGGVSNGWNDFAKYGPTLISKTEGVYLWDESNKKYIDFCMGWGAHFLGNTPQFAKTAFHIASTVGFGIQYETDYHYNLAKKITELIPSIEKVRFTNTGTESTMQAIKIARAYTGKDLIIKFEGHFHGINDYLNFNNDASLLGEKKPSGSISTLPGSSGIPKEMSKYIKIVEFNDLDTFEKIMSNNNIAGVIMEPICLASAVMYPDDIFLKTVKKSCVENNSVLIFDEVMSGFRGGLGGAQRYLDISPDLTILSKILGCGFPISIIGGKKDIMDVLDPLGDCTVSGTNNGRLLNIIGSNLALQELEENSHYYPYIHELNDYLVKNIDYLFLKYNVPGSVRGYAGRIVIHFGTTTLKNNYRSSVNTWDRDFHMKMYEYCYEQGLFGFLLPLTYCPEPICITPMHSYDDIDRTLEIFEQGLRINTVK